MNQFRKKQFTRRAEPEVAQLHEKTECIYKQMPGKFARLESALSKKTQL